MTDGLIEYAEELRKNLDIAARSALEAEQEIEVLRDIVAKQSDAMSAHDEEIAKLRAEIQKVKDAAIGVAMMVSEQAEA